MSEVTMTLRLPSRRSCLAAAALSALALQAGAQAFPDKPVRLLVGYAPGGSTDIIGRVLAAHLSTRWGQQPIRLKEAEGGTLPASA
jgi:tripartite-type tricarboxylate transporter receptor subunit TctC